MQQNVQQCEGIFLDRIYGIYGIYGIEAGSREEFRLFCQREVLRTLYALRGEKEILSIL